MSILGFLSEKSVDILLDAIVDGVKERINSEFSPEFQSIEFRLKQIKDQMDRDRAATFIAGLSFLRRNKLEKAEERFIDAEAANPHGALIKLWLGIVLAKLGEKVAGYEKMEEALGMNPFVLPKSILDLDLFHTSSVEKLPDFKWTKLLNNQDLINKTQNLIPPTFLDMLAAAFVGGEKHGALLAISCSGQNPVISWHIDDNFARNDTPKYCLISAFDLLKGDILWTKYFPNRELYFATDRYVILLEKGETNYLELLDVNDGRSLEHVNEDYFIVTFCPHTSLEAIQAFSRSNKSFQGFAVYYNSADREMSILRKKRNLWDRFMDIPPEHKVSDTEVKVALPALFPDLFSVSATNVWNYDSYGRTYRIGDRTQVAETLICEASMTVTRGNNYLDTQKNP